MQTCFDRVFSALCAVLILIGFSACAGSRSNVEYEMEKMAVRQQMFPQPVQRPSVESEGSLWQTTSSLNAMFIDTKARNIGDIVTVKIEESAKATNKANTETERTSGLEAGIEKLFGLEDWWTNKIRSLDLPILH